MFRQITAVILLLLVIVGGIFLQNYITDKSEEIARGIPLSISASSAEELDISYAEFRKVSPLFSTLYVHSSLNEITDSFEKSFALLGLQDEDRYIAEATHLQYLLTTFPSAGAPTIESIF